MTDSGYRRTGSMLQAYAKLLCKRINLALQMILPDDLAQTAVLIADVLNQMGRLFNEIICLPDQGRNDTGQKDTENDYHYQE